MCVFPLSLLYCVWTFSFVSIPCTLSMERIVRWIIDIFFPLGFFDISGDFVREAHLTRLVKLTKFLISPCKEWNQLIDVAFELCLDEYSLVRKYVVYRWDFPFPLFLSLVFLNVCVRICLSLTRLEFFRFVWIFFSYYGQLPKKSTPKMPAYIVVIYFFLNRLAQSVLGSILSPLPGRCARRLIPRILDTIADSSKPECARKGAAFLLRVGSIVRRLTLHFPLVVYAMFALLCTTDIEKVTFSLVHFKTLINSYLLFLCISIKIVL